MQAFGKKYLNEEYSKLKFVKCISYNFKLNVYKISKLRMHIAYI